MTIGRLILTHREDLIIPLRDFYLNKRTDFLVISYHQLKVDPKKFKQADNFRLVPFYGPGEKFGQKGHIMGQQFRVWADVARNLPQISSWVTHDYDVLCKPSDKEIFSHITENQYGLIGKPIPVWQDGMKQEPIDMFPFDCSHERFHRSSDTVTKSVENLIDSVLMDNFPTYHQGIKTLLGGYGDIIASASKNLVLLDDPKIKNLSIGGSEQVPQTIFKTHGIEPVDLRNFYSVKIPPVNYVKFSNPYDISSPVKYWPGSQKPTLKARIKNTARRTINFFKGKDY